MKKVIKYKVCWAELNEWLCKPETRYNLEGMHMSDVLKEIKDKMFELAETHNYKVFSGAYDG